MHSVTQVSPRVWLQWVYEAVRLLHTGLLYAACMQLPRMQVGGCGVHFRLHTRILYAVVPPCLYRT